jgi:hypothetical protein
VGGALVPGSPAGRPLADDVDGGEPLDGLAATPGFRGIVVVGTGAEVPPTIGVDGGAPGARPGMVVVAPGGLTVPAAAFTVDVVTPVAELLDAPPLLHAAAVSAATTAAPMPRRIVAIVSLRRPAGALPPAP